MRERPADQRVCGLSEQLESGRIGEDHAVFVVEHQHAVGMYLEEPLELQIFLMALDRGPERASEFHIRLRPADEARCPGVHRIGFGRAAVGIPDDDGDLAARLLQSGDRLCGRRVACSEIEENHVELFASEGDACLVEGRRSTHAEPFADSLAHGGVATADIVFDEQNPERSRAGLRHRRRGGFGVRTTPSSRARYFALLEKRSGKIEGRQDLFSMRQAREHRASPLGALLLQRRTRRRLFHAYLRIFPGRSLHHGAPSRCSLYRVRAIRRAAADHLPTPSGFRRQSLFILPPDRTRAP
jgi:hypothetical protein